MKLLRAAVLMLAAALIVSGCGEPKSFTYRRGLDHYGAKRYAEAFPLVREAAEAGNTQAKATLGVMYLQGQGTPADGVQAERWLLEAAQHGIVGAQSVIGLMYVSGVGVPRNPEKAVQWLTLAANAGDAEASMLLKRMGR